MSNAEQGRTQDLWVLPCVFGKGALASITGNPDVSAAAFRIETGQAVAQQQLGQVIAGLRAP